MKAKDQTHWVMQEITEQEAEKNAINLWPRIAARAESLPNQAGVRTHRKKVEKAALSLVFVLLGIGLFFIVPQARAFAESVFQHMGIAFVDTHQLGDDVTVQQAEMIPVTPSPSLSLEEIRHQISFSLLVPAWMPDGLNSINRGIREYDPTQTAGSGQKVIIEYSRTADFNVENGVLRLSENDGPIGSPPLLAASREQSVTVNGLPGIYVHGGWQNDGRGDPDTRMGSLMWDDTADDAYLTWTQDGVTYLLEAHNLGLGLDNLLHIASSMSSQ